jgi:ABC-type antimicrobial peptide transport system permease subunit
MIEARTSNLIADAQRDITALLRQRHRTPEASDNDFQIRNLTEMQNAANAQTETLSILLGSVALVSLIVGAIGIANVMLVSVTERTREIGIRMAVGARGRDVLFQFLIEAVVLACVGGVMGLVLGSAFAKYMALRAQWPALLSPPVMAGTMALAGFAGIVAGFYPALRASRLDPIDALRFE